tara:strand:+ start:5639 stop:6373 length:735 start_codon:yes stop_codon:yes gene_type:complete
MLGLLQGSTLETNRKDFDTFSLLFNGTDESVDLDPVANSLEGTAGSISLWAKLSTVSTTGNLFRAKVDSNNFFNILYHASANELRFAYKAGGTNKTAVTSDAIEGDGKWHHIVATWNASEDEIKLYLDGTLKATTTGLGTFSGTLSEAGVGQNLTDGGFYKGYISNVAVFNRTITATDVLYIQNRSATDDAKFYPMDISNMANLVGYYRFEAGSGTTAFDSSGNGKNGTLVNTPTWNNTTPTKN